jgi:hypothetical protein
MADFTKTCPTIAKSNVQAIFVEIEEVSGVLQRPTVEGYVLPTGQGSLNQTPNYTNSDELSKSLNVMAQFQDAVGPGDASVPSYIRLAADGGKPQGYALLAALMGDTQAPDDVTATVSADVDAAVTTIPVDDIAGGFFPQRGVVLIESERIHYTGVTLDADGNVTALTGCTRGYAQTTADAHVEDTDITLKSRVFFQDICRPTVSIHLMLDHTVVFGSGGVVTQAEVPISRSGGQNINFTLQFRRMGWCGRSFLAGVPTGGELSVVTQKGANAADAYTVGGIIKNTTRKDDNGGSGYTIMAVNDDAGTITVSPAPASWAADDQIDPWLPDAAPIGQPLESRDTRVFVNDVAGKLLEGSLTIGTPVSFSAEVGDEYPGESADTTREITLNNGMMFRAEDAIEFGRGYKGYELPIAIVLGNKAGNSLTFAMPRVKFNTPEIGTQDAFVTLTRTGAVLGSKGEDALYIIIE